MSISFKLNFHGKNGTYTYDRELIVEEVFKSILSNLNLYPTIDHQFIALLLEQEY